MTKHRHHPTHSAWVNHDGMVVHPYSPCGKSGIGAARVPGTLQCTDDPSIFPAHPDAPASRHAVPLFERFDALPKKKSKSKKLPAPKKGIELYFVGNFPSYWDKRPEKEILDAVGANVPQSYSNLSWSPSTEDFIKCAELGRNKGDPPIIKVNDPRGFLYQIGIREPSSIHRLYFFTHADEGYIGLNGTVDSHTVWFKLGIKDLDISQAMEPGVVFGEKGWTQEQLFTANVTLDRVRSAFQEDAEVIFFACHSGMETAYIARLSELFGVKVRGYKKFIRYTLYTNDHKKISKRTFGIENDPAEYKTFREMLNLAEPK